MKDLLTSRQADIGTANIDFELQRNTPSCADAKMDSNNRQSQSSTRASLKIWCWRMTQEIIDHGVIGRAKSAARLSVDQNFDSFLV